MTERPAGNTTNSRQVAYRRGRGAEWRAAWLLRLKGFRILARGYRCAVGEIDIIARRGTLLVAVEVKARANLADAADAIAPRQRQRIARALSDFVARHPATAMCDVRFDAILLAPRHWPRHITDAWRPEID